MSSQNILRFYKEVLSELKGCGKKPVRLSLLMVMLLSGCAERSTNKEYQAVFNEIDDRGRLGITSIVSARIRTSNYWPLKALGASSWRSMSQG
jgi:hypothetical protein